MAWQLRSIPTPLMYYCWIQQRSIWSWGGGKRFKRSSLAPVLDFTTRNESVFTPCKSTFSTSWNIAVDGYQKQQIVKFISSFSFVQIKLYYLAPAENSLISAGPLRDLSWQAVFFWKQPAIAPIYLVLLYKRRIKMQVRHVWCSWEAWEQLSNVSPPCQH